MKQEIPVTKSINYFALVLQSIFLILLYFIFVESGSNEPLLWSAMIYLVLAYSLRYFVPVDHRKGIRELKEGYYEAAVYESSDALQSAKLVGRIPGAGGEQLVHKGFGAEQRVVSASPSPRSSCQGRCPHSRARQTPIPASSDADRTAPAGWAAQRLLADVDISF